MHKDVMKDCHAQFSRKNHLQLSHHAFNNSKQCMYITEITWF